MSGEALVMLALLLLILCSFFGAVVFFVEAGTYDPAQREWLRPTLDGRFSEVSPFRSIPVAMWWAIVTVATVGYGDLYPTTGLGRLLGAFAVVCGLVVISLPITIVSSNFSEEFARYTQCVHSGGDGFRLTTDEFRAWGYEAAGKSAVAASEAAGKPVSLHAMMGLQKAAQASATVERTASASRLGSVGLARVASAASVSGSDAGSASAVIGAAGAGGAASEGAVAAALQALRAEVAVLRAESAQARADSAHARAALDALLRAQGVSAPAVQDKI